LKPDIVKSRARDSVTKAYQNHVPPLPINSMRFQNEVQKIQLAMLKQGTRVGIPKIGTTRKWNTLHNIMKWQLKHKQLIRHLYVFFY
jgi:hypothetical protein